MHNACLALQREWRRVESEHGVGAGSHPARRRTGGRHAAVEVMICLLRVGFTSQDWRGLGMSRAPACATMCSRHWPGVGAALAVQNRLRPMDRSGRSERQEESWEATGRTRISSRRSRRSSAPSRPCACSTHRRRGRSRDRGSLQSVVGREPQAGLRMQLERALTTLRKLDTPADEDKAEIEGHRVLWSDENLKQAMSQVERALAALRELGTPADDDEPDNRGSRGSLVGREPQAGRDAARARSHHAPQPRGEPQGVMDSGSAEPRGDEPLLDQIERVFPGSSPATPTARSPSPSA